MVSGIGNMVGREFLEAPVRERELAAHDLNMRTGEQHLARTRQVMDLDEEKIKELGEAREKQKRYVDILAEHRGDPAATFNALHDAGMPDLALQYRELVHELRKKAAEAGKAETEEAATQHRILGETLLNFQQNYPPEERDAVYPVVRRQLQSVLGEDSPFLELFPETPEPGTYELMGILGELTRSQADILAMKKGELERLDKESALEEKKQNRQDELAQKAYAAMGRMRSPKGWILQREHQVKRLSPEKAAIFEADIPPEYSPEARKKAQELGKAAVKLPANYQAYLNTGGKGSYLEFLRLTGEKEGLTPSESQKAINLLLSIAKAQKSPEYGISEFKDVSLTKLMEQAAKDLGLDLSKLIAIAGGTSIDQEPHGSEHRLQELPATPKGPRMAPPQGRAPLPMQLVPSHDPEVMRDGNGFLRKKRVVHSKKQNKTYQEVGPGQWREIQ